DARGVAKRPFISWQDGRAASTAQKLAADPALADFPRHAGTHAPTPAQQISLLVWLTHAEPRLVTRDDAVCGLADFVTRELSGQAWTDDNLAAMSGLYSLELGDYWSPALEACGIVRGQLPRVAPVGTSPCATAERAADYGLAPGIPIVCAGNDQTGGAYGAGVHETGALLVTLGTAQVAYLCCDARPQSKPSVIRGIYPGGKFYALTIAEFSGSTISWAVDEIEGCDSVEDLFDLAGRSSSGAHGLVFEPTGKTGEGRWRGVAEHHVPADFARAVLDAGVARLAEAVDLLDADPGRTPVWAAGGGSQSELWMKLLAERLGTTITPVDADPLLGAARMAVRCLR
ncbi:MAG TPA: FGGY family carbohydrate kinase, partial [Planctomycetota bacterium]|nr:FGGY family carbohydrate kinase [Planctomycetota bacterium]